MTATTTEAKRMQDLKLIGVHEDGDHLLLADGDGGRYRLALDDACVPPPVGTGRAWASCRSRSRGLRPRDVQSLIRSGLTAPRRSPGRSGWTVEKVRRFEGPVLARARVHRRTKARATVLAHDGKSAETFGERVETRLRDRWACRSGAVGLPAARLPASGS